MKTVLIIVLLLVSPYAAAFAQQSDMQTKMEQSEKPVALLSGLGSLHHPTSSKNQEAQKFFDQGFGMAYGFNHEEAVRSFKRAAELDPEDGHGLVGCGVCVGAKHQFQDAATVQREFQRAWKNADTKLTVSDL